MGSAAAAVFAQGGPAPAPLSGPMDAPGPLAAAAPTRAPAVGGAPLTDTWAAVLAVILACGVATLGMLVSLQPSHFVVWYWAWAVVSGFWLAASTLPRTRMLWAFLRVIGWNLLLYLGLELLFVVIFRRFVATHLVEYLHARFPRVSFGAAEIAALQRQLFVQAVAQLMVLVLVASILGAACALLLARWSRARALPRPTGFEHTAGLPLLTLAGVLLLYFGILVALFAVVANQSATARPAADQSGAGLALAWAYLVPVIGAIAITWFAAWHARRALARQPTSR
jgi:hypothetical protein